MIDILYMEEEDEKNIFLLHFFCAKKWQNTIFTLHKKEKIVFCAYFTIRHRIAKQVTSARLSGSIPVSDMHPSFAKLWFVKKQAY